MTVTRTPSCTVRDCPHPKSPEFHIPICGHGLEGHHHHVTKRSQGGKDGPQVFICPSCHDNIDNGLWGNAITETYRDGQKVTVYRAWDLKNKTLIERVLSDGAEAVIPTTDAPTSVSAPSPSTKEESDAETERPEGHSSDSVGVDSFRGGSSDSRITGDNSPGALAPLTHEQRVAIAPSPRVGYSPMGLEIPEDLTYEEWEVVVNTLKGMEKSIRWWWGDLIGFGEKNYGETYAQALDEDVLAYGSLADSLWVSKQIESSRRRENLSWSHHREVAKLEPAEQDRWLLIAEEEHLGHKELRERLRGDGDVLIIPKLYQCPECGFTAKREGFREVS